MGLTSAEGQKARVFQIVNKKYLFKCYENLLNLLCSKVISVFNLTQALSLCVCLDIYVGIEIAVS
jgi:hypothetical protein